MNAIKPAFGGRLGDTVEQSTPWWPERPARNRAVPNQLQIIFDDTGWADLGCFGSEIETPNLDRLAGNGLRYSNFHVTPLCSPTRACLMTGQNHHRVGMRFLADIDTGFPNSRGAIDPGVPMLPQRLREAGFGTYLVGKWHLTPQHEITPAGPYHNWPLARGFDKFYGFLDGCTDQFAPELCQDNQVHEPRIGADYHLSADLADRAITFIADHVVFRPNDPFFLTLALGATHAPLQAPRHLIDKYVPVFEKGWDAIREQRLARQIDLGLVPPGTALTPRNPGVPAWSELGADEKRLFVRLQAAYAAFLEHADAQIGRVLAQLAALGIVDDTLVLVLSDNGASREGGRFGAVDINGPYSGVRETIAEQLDRIDSIGGPEGPAHYPEGWGMAGNTPFRRYKQSVDLGGVRSPLIVSWPNGIAGRGQIRTQFAHAIDIAATLADLARLPSDPHMDGASLKRSFGDAAAPAPRSTQHWEMFGHRAIWQDGWVAVTEHRAGVPYDADTWRLYRTHTDFAHNQDLAAQYPERLETLIASWWQAARDNGVLPLDDRSLVQLLNGTTSPYQMANRTQLVLQPANSHLPVSSGVTSTNRTMRLTAQLIRRRAGESGVIVASGSGEGGHVLYLLADELVLEHIALGERVVLHTPAPVTEAPVTLGFDIVRGDGDSAMGWLTVNGRRTASAPLPRTLIHPAFWGLDVGRDPVSPVSRRYADCPELPAGVLQTVTLDFAQPMSVDDMAELIAATE